MQYFTCNNCPEYSIYLPLMFWKTKFSGNLITEKFLESTWCHHSYTNAIRNQNVVYLRRLRNFAKQFLPCNNILLTKEHFKPT